jgi:2-hydroxychromene-2-carboxylate isomerase
VAAPAQTQPIFYYDLGNPVCYLVAERITAALPVVAEWEPVLGSELDGTPAPVDRQAIEASARAQELQPIRWPPEWPIDSRLSTLAATYAKRVGRVVAFSLAAFRQTFAAGRDLGALDTVLIAAAACEMHPSALLKAIELRSVGEAAQAASARAREAGARTVPAIQVGAQVMEGDECVERATAALA